MKNQPCDGDLVTVITEISRDQATMADLLSHQESDPTGTTSLLINQLKAWSEKLMNALERPELSRQRHDVES